MKRYFEWVIRHRLAVVIATLLVTVLAGYQAKNLRIVIDPNTMLPQSHPYISTGVDVARVFGSKYIVVVGITPRQGDVYRPDILAKVQDMTTAFEHVPGVVKGNVLSLYARRAKSISGSSDGLEVKPLTTPSQGGSQQMAVLERVLKDNPVYFDNIVARDGKTASIIVEFKEDAGGYAGIMNKVNPIVDRARDATVEINVGGAPNFLARIEAY